MIFLTDEAGFVANEYRYDAYGRPLDLIETVENPYLYTAREFDPESGLYHYRARAYDPATGRFLQEDPLGFAAGDLNLYRYVLNNPINATDPDGLFAPNCVRNPRTCGFDPTRTEGAGQGGGAGGGGRPLPPLDQMIDQFLDWLSDSKDEDSPAGEGSGEDAGSSEQDDPTEDSQMGGDDPCGTGGGDGDKRPPNETSPAPDEEPEPRPEDVRQAANDLVEAAELIRTGRGQQVVDRFTKLAQTEAGRAKLRLINQVGIRALQAGGQATAQHANRLKTVADLAGKLAR